MSSLLRIHGNIYYTQCDPLIPWIFVSDFLDGRQKSMWSVDNSLAFVVQPKFHSRQPLVHWCINGFLIKLHVIHVYQLVEIKSADDKFKVLSGQVNNDSLIGFTFRMFSVRRLLFSNVKVIIKGSPGRIRISEVIFIPPHHAICFPPLSSQGSVQKPSLSSNDRLYG